MDFFFIASNVFATCVNRQDADEFLVRFYQDQKAKGKKTEDETLKRRKSDGVALEHAGKARRVASSSSILSAVEHAAAESVCLH